jgi:hypothetical protein
MHIDAPLRKPVFDIAQVMKPVSAFLIRLYDSVIEGRRLQSAFQIAQHLKAINPDYRHMSMGDIVKQIMSDK